MPLLTSGQTPLGVSPGICVGHVAVADGLFEAARGRRHVATIAAELGLMAAEVKAHMFGLTPTVVWGEGMSSGSTEKTQLHLVE